jgi:hypothetical protein
MNGRMMTAIVVAVAAASAAATALFIRSSDSNSAALANAANRAGEYHPRADDDHLKGKGADQGVVKGSEPDRVIETVLREIELLRMQVGKLERQQADTRLSEDGLLPMEEGEIAEPSLRPEEFSERREALVKRHKDLLDNRLRKEKMDSQWADSAQAKLSSAYGAATDKGVHFVGAECRSTMCRVDMALHQPGKPGEMQLRRLMDGPTPWPGPRFLQMDRQTGDVVMYMMREDYALPTLPSEMAIGGTP